MRHASPAPPRAPRALRNLVGVSGCQRAHMGGRDMPRTFQKGFSRGKRTLGWEGRLGLILGKLQTSGHKTRGRWNLFTGNIAGRDSETEPNLRVPCAVWLRGRNPD